MRIPNLVSRVSSALIAPILAMLACGALHGEGKPDFDIRGHYTKYEYRIAMRDGVTLFTAVYVPKDSSKPYPFLMNRTPYSVSPYGVDKYPPRLGPSHEFAEAGYIFVNQDVRGRWQSDGVFSAMSPHIDHPTGTQVDESTDTFDTVEWLLKHIPNNNGKVGIEGVSFPGFYAAASVIDSHPAIKACSPEAPVTDLYMNDDCYHNGAFIRYDRCGFGASDPRDCRAARGGNIDWIRSGAAAGSNDLDSSLYRFAKALRRRGFGKGTLPSDAQ